MFTGAVPVMSAVLLLIAADGLSTKLAAFSTASWEAILLRAEVSQGRMPVAGFSTLRLCARNVLYLAVISGPLLATFRGPFTNSWSARQYMRRKVGSL